MIVWVPYIVFLPIPSLPGLTDVCVVKLKCIYSRGNALFSKKKQQYNSIKHV